MKKYLFIPVIGYLLLTNEAKANNKVEIIQPTQTRLNRYFETEVNIGGPIGLINTNNTTSSLTFSLSQRAWLPRNVSPFGLELRAVISRDGCFGLGISPMLSLVNTDAFQLFISIGVFLNTNDAISVKYLKRDYDIIWSIHANFKLIDNLYLSTSYNTFFPDPGKMLKLGDYGRPIAIESLSGGQLWFGVNFQY